MSNIVKTGGLAKHEIKDVSGQKALCKKDGNYCLDVQTAEVSISAKNNHVLKLVTAIADVDEKGGVVYWNKPVTGSHSFEDTKTGKTVTVEHMDELGNVLDSAGLSDYKLQIAKAGEFDLDKVAAKILAAGKLYVVLTQQEDKETGVRSSEIKHFTTKERYEKNVCASTHRSEPRLKTPITTNGAATSSPNTRSVVTDAQRNDI